MTMKQVKSDNLRPPKLTVAEQAIIRALFESLERRKRNGKSEIRVKL